MHTDITWTDGAWEQFKDTLQRIHNLRVYYGDQLADEHEAEFYRTFQRVTFAAGPVNVQRDGHGFYVSYLDTGFVVGIVWTPDGDARMRPRVNRTVSNGSLVEADEPIPADWPRTGRWSAHS